MVIAVALGACSDPDAARQAEARETYIVECAQCHQREGQGYGDLYPNLAGNPIVMLDSPELTIRTVLDGRGSMPAFRHQLSIQDLAAIVSYIRTAWGNDASPVGPTEMR